MKAEDLKKELKKYINPEKVDFLPRFFKTGEGQYGEGDVFIAVTVPDSRKVAKKFTNLSLAEVKKLLYSKIHEERLCALLILVEKFAMANFDERKKVFDFYMTNAKQVNNWDLVDLSAPKIVGKYLLENPRDLSQMKSQFDSVNILYKFALSKNLWEKRISIISTYAFIKNRQYNDTFKIAEILMSDKHDLIHKAVGWMLREVGKMSLKDEEVFLKKYYKRMPRTMLRYAIEKFPENKRKYYLAK